MAGYVYGDVTCHLAGDRKKRRLIRFLRLEKDKACAGGDLASQSLH
jgi:hypothetical protein